MISAHFLQGRRREQLSEDEREALEGIFSPPVTLPRRAVVVRRGELVSQSTFLISGLMCRYIDAADGQRQFVSIETPGDFVDLHGFPLQRLDHDIATLCECRVAYAPHRRITEAIERFPHLGRMLWFATLLDAAMHREWVFRLGRLGADGRVAHLICETHARLKAVGLVHNGEFDWPLTQQDMGEACGLTSVHINRTLRVLRESGVVELSDRKVKILDLEALVTLGEFVPDYLYIGDNTPVP